jgi:hypothetical protein
MVEPRQLRSMAGRLLGHPGDASSSRGRVEVRDKHHDPAASLGWCTAGERSPTFARYPTDRRRWPRLDYRHNPAQPVPGAGACVMTEQNSRDRTSS